MNTYYPLLENGSMNELDLTFSTIILWFMSI